MLYAPVDRHSRFRTIYYDATIHLSYLSDFHLELSVPSADQNVFMFVLLLHIILFSPYIFT